jgi:nitrogen fixation/metabolism regulation signal transduction histidine kinase
MSHNLLKRLIFSLLIFLGLGILAVIAFWKNYPITGLLLVVATLLALLNILAMVQRTLRTFYDTLASIEMDDFSQNFTFRNSLPKHLQQNLQQILEKFRKIRLEKESQYLYLRSVVQHIPIGIFSFNQTGKIDFYNNAVLHILRCSPFRFLHELPEAYAPLLEILEKKHSPRKMVRLMLDDEVLELIVTLSEVQILGETFKIVSLQDFQAELEEKEMEAWQNLTRILTHEIMNSVTPISSLASTILDSLKENPNDLDEIEQGVKVIEKRSQNLIQFVQEFRAFTKLPVPNPQKVLIKEVFERLERLIATEIKEKNIHFRSIVYPEDLHLTTDLMMLEQILINLLKNAIQAVSGKEKPEIKLVAQYDILGKVMIKVQDNGTGISEEARKSIFVPFFTTKKAGSGIGLSLSRQMMRLQGGSISVSSKLGEGSTFSLRFA